MNDFAHFVEGGTKSKIQRTSNIEQHSKIQFQFCLPKIMFFEVHMSQLCLNQSSDIVRSPKKVEKNLPISFEVCLKAYSN